ncbi:MAG: glycine zipper family protein [Deltaproteobacteria bacterium]|nr:glycine zipper family protein [Deltaproteobacteria bacterium]
MRKRSVCLLLAAAIFMLGACATQPKKEVGFRLPSEIPNHVNIDGAIVGVISYADRDQAKEAFGFDIVGAGLLPVQVVINNQSNHVFQIETTQTMLFNQQRLAYNILPSQTAYERIEKKGELAGIAGPAAKSGALGAVAGAIIGTAVAVVTGDNVAGGAGTGAVVGAAAGSVLAGAGTMTGGAKDETHYKVVEDLDRRSLGNRDMPPWRISHGFLFFPAEAGTPSMLQLKLIEKDTGVVFSRDFALPAAE